MTKNTPQLEITGAPLQVASSYILLIEGIADDGMALVQFPQNGHGSDKGLKLIMSGSLQHQFHIAVPGTVNQVVMLVGAAEQPFEVKLPAVVVNCIVDPDSSVQALIKAEKMIEHIQKSANKIIPVINPPHAIRQTQRELIYQNFHEYAALQLPRTIRFTPRSVADVVKQAIEAGFNPPFIIRPAGTHGGVGLQAINSFSPKELLKLECYAYDGRSFYITEWVDFKSVDGLYRKSRILCVNGQFIPRHRIIHDSWMIHSKSRKSLMHDREDLRAEEEVFVSTPLAKSINAKAFVSLKKIAAELGLGYFGIDCAIHDDGSVLIFEINAAFNAMVQDDLALFPYLAKPVAAVKGAFNDMVAEKIGIARAA